MPNYAPPSLAVSQQNPLVIRATGVWHVHALAEGDAVVLLGQTMQRTPRRVEARWDLSQIDALDHIGAQWLWNAWGRRRPAQLTLNPQHESLFATIERAQKTGQDAAQAKTDAPPGLFAWAWHHARQVLGAIRGHLVDFLALIGQLSLDSLRFASAPQLGPWREISANIYHIGYRALGITALVGILIGVVLSYLSAQQLHSFGGDVFLVNILGMSIIRELGPMLAAILVAGRSGSAITAQLGVMRVTEELDAMLVMGMPHGFRLVLPRALALALAMPLLVIWTDAMALSGGMIAARVELNFSPLYFLDKLPDVVPLVNYWIGLAKGVVFGCLIALVACHFGLRIKPDTESLGQGTTQSVVTAITAVIVADAIFAIIFSNTGYQ
ncbi:MAG TPA: ABC transporter permease [Burkholderiaceae bacterium]